MRSSTAAYVALDHGDVHLTLSRDPGFVHSGNNAVIVDEPR